MGNFIKEQKEFFGKILKWSILSVFSGIFAGGISVLFLKCLDYSISIVQVNRYFMFFLPIILFLNIFIIKHTTLDAQGYGSKLINSINREYGRISLLIVPIKFITTILTIAFGGSAGKEGPCAHMGSAISSNLSDLLKLQKSDRRTMAICGIGAGFSAVFGAPIAGTLFAIEILELGGITYKKLFPTIISAFVGYFISNIFQIRHYAYYYDYKESYSLILLGEIVLSGIIFGFVALLMIETLKQCEKLYKKIDIYEPLKGLIGGVIIVILALIFSTRYLGLGADTVTEVLEGENVPGYAFLLKMIFTAITLHFGGNGGILFPLLFVGSTAGNSFAAIFGLDIKFFSAIGMVSVLAGAINAPICAGFLAFKIFGPIVGTYASISCILSYVICGKRSVWSRHMIKYMKKQ